MRPSVRAALLIALAPALTAAACRRHSYAKSAGIAGASLASREAVVMQAGRAPAPAAEAPARDGSPPPEPPIDGRKLIRNGEVSLEVRDFEASSRKVGEVARSFGGYVVDSQAGGDTGRRTGTVVIRVRADAFEEALQALRALGKVQSEHVRPQDNTKAYTDLDTRLRVKRDAAERIREILKTRSTRLADVLAAEKELSGLVEQIETMEGEKRFYDQQIALATIAAELHEPEAVARPSAFAPLRAAVRDSLYNLSESLAAFLTGILYVLPWAALLIALSSAWRRRQRRRSRSSSSSPGFRGSWRFSDSRSRASARPPLGRRCHRLRRRASSSRSLPAASTSRSAEAEGRSFFCTTVSSIQSSGTTYGRASAAGSTSCAMTGAASDGPRLRRRRSPPSRISRSCSITQKSRKRQSSDARRGPPSRSTSRSITPSASRI